MKNAPDWLKAAIAESGAQVVTGGRQQADAAEAVKAAILARPEFVDELASALAAKQVSDWLKVHRSSGDLFQAALFPGVPVVMYTSPGRSMAVADMTLADLDNARTMLLTRTRNVKAAANRAERDFARLYAKVKPLLKDGRTVADVLGDLALKAA